MKHQHRAGGTLTPILPGPPPAPHPAFREPFNGQCNDDSQSSRAPTKPKRSAISIACENCRRRKAKCNGSKPVCRRCQSRGDECVYELDRGKALTTVLKQQQGDLLRENDQYRQLFQLLRSKPEIEALEMLQFIREASEPEIILEATMQTETPLPNLSSTDLDRVLQMQRLDCEALAASAIQVPARPWTVVAGDGLVSELITNHFTLNGTYFYPIFNQTAFIEDMRSGNIGGSGYCTPLLVNAICAVESNFSHTARQFGDMTRQNLPDRFFEEAKGLLEREQGRASIPNVVALVFMYVAMSIMGKDRVARMYRYAAYALLNRLSLEEKFLCLESTPGGEVEMDIISRALWGLFVMESRIAFYYSQPSILPVPRVPKPVETPAMGNVDVLGRLHTESSSTIPLVPGVNAVNCDLAELWNEVMLYTCEHAIVGSDNDLRIRKTYYCKLLDYMAQLPPNFHFKNNLTPTTCLVRMHETEIIFTILRDLPLDTPFHTLYNHPGTTAKDILRQRCVADVELLQCYVQNWKSLDCLVARHAHLCLHILIPMLEYPVVHSSFVTACMITQQASTNMKVMGYLLQAVQAFAWAMKKKIPESAKPFLQGWGAEAIEPDLPMGFVLPQQDEVRAAFARGSLASLEDMEDQLGVMIERWGMMQ